MIFDYGEVLQDLNEILLEHEHKCAHTAIKSHVIVTNAGFFITWQEVYIIKKKKLTTQIYPSQSNFQRLSS